MTDDKRHPTDALALVLASALKREQMTEIPFAVYYRNNVARLLLETNWEELVIIYEKYNGGRQINVEGWNTFMVSPELWRFVHDRIVYLTDQGRATFALSELDVQESCIMLSKRHLEFFCVHVSACEGSAEVETFLKTTKRKSDPIHWSDVNVRVDQPATRAVIKALVKMLFRELYPDEPFTFELLGRGCTINDKLEYEIVK